MTLLVSLFKFEWKKPQLRGEKRGTDCWVDLPREEASAEIESNTYTQVGYRGQRKKFWRIRINQTWVKDHRLTLMLQLYEGAVEANYQIEGDLRALGGDEYQSARSISAYRGRRHRAWILPVRGRTRTNAHSPWATDSSWQKKAPSGNSFLQLVKQVKSLFYKIDMATTQQKNPVLKLKNVTYLTGWHTSSLRSTTVLSPLPNQNGDGNFLNISWTALKCPKRLRFAAQTGGWKCSSSGGWSRCGRLVVMVSVDRERASLPLGRFKAGLKYISDITRFHLMAAVRPSTASV